MQMHGYKIYANGGSENHRALCTFVIKFQKSSPTYHPRVKRIRDMHKEVNSGMCKNLIY